VLRLHGDSFVAGCGAWEGRAASVTRSGEEVRYRK